MWVVSELGVLGDGSVCLSAVRRVKDVDLLLFDNCALSSRRNPRLQDCRRSLVVAGGETDSPKAAALARHNIQ